MGKNKRKSTGDGHRLVSTVGTAKFPEKDMGYISVQCPNCDRPIRPRVMDYLPRPATYKQYRCEHCKAWLTIDLRSRMKLIALGSLGLFVFSVGVAELVIVTGGSLKGPNSSGPIIFCVLLGIGGQYLLARYMQRTAKWVIVED
jgi:DNA-directed RNA polymerase subunit RPC12/RpoP